MANTAKVQIEALYKDKTKSGMSTTSKAVAGLKRQVGLLAAAWSAKEVIAFTLEMSKLAATARLTEQTFDKLAIAAGSRATTELEILRKAVRGTLSDLELMRTVGAGVDAGLTFNQSTTALQFLRRYSLAFGKDFQQLTKTIFTGLQRGSVQFLDDAGIILSATDSMFAGMGELEKKSALVGEAIRLMGEKMKHLPEIEENAATNADRLAVAWENIGLAIGDLAGPAMSKALELLADAATGMATFMSPVDNSAGAVLSRLLEERRSLIVAIADPDGLEAATGPASDTAGMLREDRLAAVQAYIAILEKEKKTLGERAELVQKAMAAGKQHEVDEKAAAADRVAANKEYLEQFMETNAAVNEMRSERVVNANREAEEIAELQEAEDDAFHEAEAKRFEDRLATTDAIVALETAASGDVIKIKTLEIKLQERAELARMRALGATAEELQKVRDLYKELAEQMKAGVEDSDSVRRFKLIFEADVSSLESGSDLAYFALGKVLGRLKQMGGPIVAGFIDAFGALLDGKPMAAAAAGIGIVVDGLFSVFGGGVDAKVAMRELEDTLRDLADASGSLRSELAGEGLDDLGIRFDRLIEDINDKVVFSGARAFSQGAFRDSVDLSDYIDVETGLVDLQRLNQVVGDLNLQKGNGEGFLEMFAELDAVADAMARLGGGNGAGIAADYRTAIDELTHIMKLEDVQDPTVKIRLLRDAMSAIGIIVSESGELSGDLAQLNLQQLRNLRETIADLQRDITAEEIAIRHEQADILIEGIKKNADRISDALKDQEQATKQAALRSVRLQFDVKEQALRQSFQGQLKGAAGDPFETQRIVMEAQSEIALLQLSEQNAATAVLADIRTSFDAAEDANQAVMQDMINAINAAADDTSVAFDVALATHIGALDFGGAFLPLVTEFTNGTVDTVAAMVAVQNTLVTETGTVRIAVEGVATEVGLVVGAVGDVTAAINSSATVNNNAAIDYGNPNWNFIRTKLEYIRQNTYKSGQIYEPLIYNRLDFLIQATNNPTWAAGGLPGGGGSGGGAATFNFDIDVTGASGSMDTEAVEGVVVDSLLNGEIGRTLGEILRALGINTRPDIPSSIRT